MASGGLSSGRVWLSSREDGRWVGGGMVVDVMRLAVFRECSRVISSSLWHWLRDLGVGVVEVVDEKSGESLSSTQTTSII